MPVDADGGPFSVTGGTGSGLTLNVTFADPAISQAFLAFTDANGIGHAASANIQAGIIQFDLPYGLTLLTCASGGTGSGCPGSPSETITLASGSLDNGPFAYLARNVPTRTPAVNDAIGWYRVDGQSAANSGLDTQYGGLKVRVGVVSATNPQGTVSIEGSGVGGGNKGSVPLFSCEIGKGCWVEDGIGSNPNRNHSGNAAGGWGFTGPFLQQASLSGQLGVFATTGANGYIFVGKSDGSGEGVFIGEIGGVPFIATDSATPLEVRQHGGALGPLKASQLTLSGIASGTQCVHANSSGVLSGTGSDCGSGGAGTAIFFVGPQTAGSANTYTQAATTPTGFALTDGYVVRTRINATNTAASTLNVNSTGAVAIKTNTVTGLAALAGGELVSGLEYDFTYNSGASAFVVSNAAAGAVVAGTTQSVTAAQWAAFTVFDVTTAAQTLTLPVSTGLSPNGGIVVKGDTQSVTVTATSPDTVNGGSAGGSVTVPAGVAALVTSDGAGHLYANLGQTLPSGANPSATASDTAVNGSATTFMRSDGAPAIQKTSSSVFGLAKVDNSTITASSGVISVLAASTSTAGVAKLHNVGVSGGWIPTVNPNNVVLGVVNQASTISAIIGAVEVATGGTATVTVSKAASGTACSAGTVLHSGSFNANGTAATNQTLTVTTSSLAAGDRLCLQTTGTTSWTGGTGVGTITVFLAPS